MTNRHDPNNGHDVRINIHQSGLPARIAQCNTCDWHGPTRYDSIIAREDAGFHIAVPVYSVDA